MPDGLIQTCFKEFLREVRQIDNISPEEILTLESKIISAIRNAFQYGYWDLEPVILSELIGDGESP